MAARRCGVPGVVHAREIPFGDPAICEWLGVDGPQVIVDAVLADADYVVACSRAVAATYPLSAATAVVPNVVDARSVDDRPPTPSGPVRIALIGSTTERKGLLEFVAVASMLTGQPHISCIVIGSESDLVLRLRASGALPDNLTFAGYVDGARAAMAMADIVVNFSLCQEASGRTILEAMGAGLPVVAYAHGGIPEAVRNGETGFLVAPGDRRAAAQRLAVLAESAALRAAMGSAGRAVAIRRYSHDSLCEALAAAYRAILPER